MRSRFSRPAVSAFEAVFRPWMRRHVHAVHVAGLPAASAQLDPRPPAQGTAAPALRPDRPLILAANHVSWWDGFVLREAQRRLRPDAPLYTLMREDELDRRPFLRLLGVVGIDAGSPASLLRAIRLLQARVRERPNSVVLTFPQGRIWPSHRRPLGFRRGVEVLARELDAAVLPVGVHMEPLNQRAPSFFVGAGSPLSPEAPLAEVELGVEAALDGVLAFLARHGEDAPARWPGAGEAITAGG